jgi:hypothetical protein
MSLSVYVMGLLTGLSLIVAIGTQNVSRPTSAVTTPRTSGVRDGNDLSRGNHWGWRSTPTFLLTNCRVYALL